MEYLKERNLLNETNNYLLIIGDLAIGSNVYKYEEIIDELFSKKEWIFGNKGIPKVKNFKDGDNVILYVSGIKKRFFYATFKFSGVAEKYQYNAEIDKPFFKFFGKKINIKDINLCSEKIYFKDLKDNLDFITDKKNYGLHLRQSVKQLSEKDYDFIMKKLK